MSLLTFSQTAAAESPFAFFHHPTMKTSRILFLAASLLLASAAFANDPTTVAASSPVVAQTNRLWIAVHLVKNTKPSWVGDDMAATFADTMVKTLRTQGFQGQIGVLRPQDALPSQASVLVVRLTSWSAKDGASDCTFTASVRTNDGDAELGLFNGDDMIVTADGQHRISSDGLQGSALEAMNDLYRRLIATKLLGPQ